MYSISHNPPETTVALVLKWALVTRCDAEIQQFFPRILDALHIELKVECNSFRYTDDVCPWVSAIECIVCKLNTLSFYDQRHILKKSFRKGSGLSVSYFIFWVLHINVGEHIYVISNSQPTCDLLIKHTSGHQTLTAELTKCTAPPSCRATSNIPLTAGIQINHARHCRKHYNLHMPHLKRLTYFLQACACLLAFEWSTVAGQGYVWQLLQWEFLPPALLECGILWPLMRNLEAHRIRYDITGGSL